METGERPAEGFGDLSRPYQKKARLALPLLIRQAHARQPIYYSHLAPEIGLQNARNLNFPLGAIGGEMVRISKRWKIQIPPLSCIVINKIDGTPSRGVGWFLPDPAAFKRLTSEQKKHEVDRILQDIYDFPQWLEVLLELNLVPAHSKSLQDLEKQAKAAKAAQGRGEGPDHKAAKDYVTNNPQLFGVSRKATTQQEYPFVSADCLDVLFRNGSEWVGAEVKGKLSVDSDIERGIFQCVKYLALMAAHQKVMQITVIAE